MKWIIPSRWVTAPAGLALLLIAPFLLAGCDNKEDLPPIHLDFVTNKGAAVSEEEIDEAVKKINEIFKPAGIQFDHPGKTIPLNDESLPRKPKHGAGQDEATEEQKKVAAEARKASKKQAGEKGTPGEIVIKVVENFSDPERPEFSRVNGITINGVIVVADPSHIEANTQRKESFWHTIAHELGHALGLTHKVLPSDKDYKSQAGGKYTSPNLMNPESNERDGDSELTSDQVDELKKQAKKLIEKRPKPL